MELVRRVSRKGRAAFLPGLLITLSVSAVAVADTIIGDADSATNSIAADIQSGITLGADQSKTARFGLLVNDNATDPINGCNAAGNAPVVMTVTSNKSWLTVSATANGTYASSATISVTACDSSGSLSDGLDPGALLHYKTGSVVPAGEQASVTAAYQSGGKDASNATGFQPGSFTSGSFTVTGAQTDTTKPVITASATAGGNPYTADTWTNQDVIVSFSCTDEAGGSGIKTNTVAGATASAETSAGSLTNTGICEDNAGNVADSATFSPIKIDKTKPVVTATAKKADDTTYVADTWTNQSVTVSFSCADGGSGLASNSVSGGGTQSSDTSNGSFTNTGGCTDNAGNAADSVTFSPIKVDKTKPVVTATAKNGDDTTYVADTWTNQSVTVSFSCADGGSGLASDTVGGGGTQSSNTSNGSFTNTGGCTDNAGNAADSVTFSPIKVDKAAPSVACDPSAADGNWHATNVSFDCTGGDTLSGLADATNDAAFNLATSVADGVANSNASTGSRTVFDNAGNSSPAGPITGNKIDREDPAVTCDTPAPQFVIGQAPANVTGTASDGSGSGLATSATPSEAVSTSSIVSSGSVDLSATDNVGNADSVSCSYSVIYDWDGFFRPVDNPSVLNTVKAGSAVPVKFTLGGDQGLAIFAATTGGGMYPISVPITCGQNPDQDGIEQTVTAGQSSLAYDPITEQYTYVWKTLKEWATAASPCRQLVVKLADGTYHRANFKFTKS